MAGAESDLSRPREAVLAVLLALAAASYAYRTARIAQASGFEDFRVMFRASAALVEGRSPYEVAAMREAPFAAHYKYPPLFAALIEPLRPLGFRRAARVWLAFLEACYAAALVILVRSFGLRFRSPAFYAAAITALVFQPSLDSLGGGQLDALLLLLLAAAWASLAAGRETPAGAPIALAAMLKVYPGLLAAHLVVRRRWRALATGLASAIALLALSVLLAGWEAHQEFVTGVLPANAGGTAWVENQSLFGFFARFFVDGAVGGPGKETRAPAAALLAAVAGAALLALTLLAGAATRDEAALFGALIAAVLMALPVAWIHYEVILLIPLIDLMARQSKRGDAAAGIALLVATMLLAFGNQQTVLRHPAVPQSFKLYGVLLVWALEMQWLWPWRAGRHG
jgi:alpha-1,2-mannosyltransferase